MKVSEFYDFAKTILVDTDEKTLKNEINILLETYLKLDFTQLFLEKERELTGLEFKLLRNALILRARGVPIQYIIGFWNFMDMNLLVGNGVLIPREDTMALVEIALENFSGSGDSKVIDLCSGSGCVALALEKNLINFSEIYALEYSDKAFEYLSKNLKNMKSKVKAVKGDVFKSYKMFEDGFFDLIISNPPYVKTDDIGKLQREVLFEPKMALDGGKDGLDFYKAICGFWIPKLKIGGKLAFEIGDKMYDEVRNIMESSGLKDIKDKEDIGGNIRSIIGTK